MERELDYDAIVARADALIAGTVRRETSGPGRLEGEDRIIGENLERMVTEGMADETTGDVETFAHYARIGRFIVQDTSQGFVSILDHGDEDHAREQFARLDAEYAAVVGDGGE